MKLPIAIQLYSVRDAAEKDIAAVLKELKSFGYDGVELAGLYGRTAREMADLLAEIGLTPVSAHVGYKEMCEDIEKVISDYKTVGCEYVAVPWMAEADRNTPETYKNLARFAKLFGAEGITLCYHNHAFEFEKINGNYGLDELYSNLPALCAEQDSCWVHVAGESPVKYLEKYKNRTPLLHLKDYVGSQSDGSFQYRPNGYGVMNIPALVAAAENCGVKWLIVEQDEPSMDKTSMECAKLSIDYLKTV